MGKNMLRLLKFAIKYPGWHSCAADARPAMRRLAKLGLLDTVAYSTTKMPQFRLHKEETTCASVDGAQH